MNREQLTNALEKLGQPFWYTAPVLVTFFLVNFLDMFFSLKRPWWDSLFNWIRLTGKFHIIQIKNK